MWFKALFFSWVFPFILTAQTQLLLVVSDDFNTAKAQLQRYEKHRDHFVKVGESIPVNLGRNGLGWSVDALRFAKTNEPIKHEGDGRAPAGIFELGEVFGYAVSHATHMSYRHASQDLICIDDSGSPKYNHITTIDNNTTVKSFEWMRRDDALYRLGVTVRHNTQNQKEMGSCIFLHVETTPPKPTAGCTSMSYEALRTLVAWLDPAKSPQLLQIPKEACSTLITEFEGIDCP